MLCNPLPAHDHLHRFEMINHQAFPMAMGVFRGVLELVATGARKESDDTTSKQD